MCWKYLGFFSSKNRKRRKSSASQSQQERCSSVNLVQFSFLVFFLFPNILGV